MFHRKSFPIMDSDMLLPVGMSALAGLSTCIGGGIVFCMPEPSKALLCFALSLAAGVMMTVSITTIVASIEENAYLLEASIALFLGALSFYLLDKLIPSVGEDETKPLLAAASSTEDGDKPSPDAAWRVGVLMMIALTAHNFPEGLAVAATAMDDIQRGSLVAIAIAVHNIPEGIVIAIPIYAATKNRCLAFTMSLISGLTEPCAALLSVCVLTSLPEHYHHLATVFVAGCMLAISLLELIPEAWKFGTPLVALGGIAFGAIVMLGTMAILGFH